MASVVALLALAVGLLVLPGAFLTVADRWLAGEPALRRRRPLPPPPPSARRPLQVVAADLRRLSRQLALVPAGASLVRWQALWAAYDDVLVEAADALEIPHDLFAMPTGLPREFERMRLLTALEDAGLVVQG
jgi:hypothetical protein